MDSRKLRIVAKAIKLLWVFILSLLPSSAFAQGIPLLKNYTTDDYHAHSYNFDIDINREGTVFVANFEGLLYYDQVEWRIIRTPGITRITVVFCDKDDSIWVGGYNYFGRVKISDNGEPYLQRVGASNLFRGEVMEIWEEDDGLLHFLVSDGKSFRLDDGNPIPDKIYSHKSSNNVSLFDVVDTDSENGDKVIVKTDTIQVLPISNTQKAFFKKGKGVSIVDNRQRELCHITEDNGLCTNNVSYMKYDGFGKLWGVTDAGIFTLAVPSAFSRFTSHEGLVGEVLSIAEYRGIKYVGTTSGLFRLEGQHLVAVSSTILDCFNMYQSSQGLLIASSSGVFLITPHGSVSQLSSYSTTSVFADGDMVYSGEMGGVYLTSFTTRQRHKVCALEKVTKILKDGKGTIWLQSIYGEVWRKKSSDKSFTLFRSNLDKIATIVPLADRVEVANAESTTPFPYPSFSFADSKGVTWMTDNEGKNLIRWKDGKRLTDLDLFLKPLKEQSVRALLVKDHEVWIGGETGLWVIDTQQRDSTLLSKPELKFRTVRLGTDSILWGGLTPMPTTLPELASNERHIRFTYAVSHSLLVSSTLYRFRLNNGRWSSWADDNDAEFVNLPYGSYTIYIQALLPSGELSKVVSMDFSIAYPFYLRWYMLLFYFLLLLQLLYGLFRYRIHRLNVEKRRLETVIQQRTAEVVQQKDEIEEKSRSLEQALNELNAAQHELLRQERMATVGKLTQGLIDRILNPLNYINNFSKLSEGLIKDVEANVEADKSHMTPENYEDTVDVLSMLRGNLRKVGEHGLHTTRTLKAMEEMLKDRSGGIVQMDLIPVLRQDEQMFLTYYADSIAAHHVAVDFTLPEGNISINGNGEQLSKAIMSILGNAIYAVVKKAQRCHYTPRVALTAATADGQAVITIFDNGIGIEQTILNKVFDPFFTTKPTSEASGVGLYLSHEIIQNHSGQITLKSQKDEYTEVTITIPLI